MSNIKFFNEPVGKQMRKAFLVAGFLCVLQLICFFLPFGEYKCICSRMEYIEQEWRWSLPPIL